MARQIYKYRPGSKAGLNDENGNDNDYKNRLIKMIPGDVLALYLACNTAITQFKGTYTHYWSVFGIVLVLMVFYLKKILKIEDWVQIVLMCISFVLWCMTLDHPFDKCFKNHDQQMLFSSLAVAIFTFAIPIFYKGKTIG